MGSCNEMTFVPGAVGVEVGFDMQQLFVALLDAQAHQLAANTFGNGYRLRFGIDIGRG